MSKITLIIIGIILLILGILGVIPAIRWAAEPMWRAIVEMAMGAVGIVVGILDRKKQ